jgi:hypothetical protein
MDGKVLCKRCNAEKCAEERNKIIAEYDKHKSRIIWLSILFVSGIFITISLSKVSKDLTGGTIAGLLIWGISGIGTAIKETFSPIPKSAKLQTKEAIAEHEAPILSFIFKIIGFFILFAFYYAVYAIALPFKLGHSIIVVQKMKKLFL